jgi:hypothetical protein
MRNALAIAVLLVILPGCSASDRQTNIDAALTDGTHVGGLLLAVQDDWLVLDLSPEEKEAQIALLDYGMIDTLRIIGEARNEDRMYGAAIGGGLGIAAGIFAANGFSFDSAKVASTSAGRTVIGVLAGLVVGGAIGYFIGGATHDSDIIVAQPEPDDYAIIRQYSVYPDTLPLELQIAIDSDKVWEEEK